MLLKVIGNIKTGLFYLTVYQYQPLTHIRDTNPYSIGSAQTLY